ncbi:MAG: hypothetical protein IPN32_25515 [Deltaproteobacteria bacterium]|nr:hypothetical protein [Deltaproteobacteria bacterium]
MLVPVAPLPSRLSITTRTARTAATADVALDRRGGPRGLSRAEDRALARAIDEALELAPGVPDEPASAPVDQFTACAHRALPVVFGVRVPRARLDAVAAGGTDAWMITRGLSITDGGLLMLALDPRSAPIDPIERVARRAWSSLWQHVDARGRSSALAMVSACVQLPQLLAAIAELAQRSGGTDAVAPIEVELIPLWACPCDPTRSRATAGDDGWTPLAPPPRANPTRARSGTSRAAGRSTRRRARGRDGRPRDAAPAGTCPARSASPGAIPAAGRDPSHPRGRSHRRHARGGGGPHARSAPPYPRQAT